MSCWKNAIRRSLTTRKDEFVSSTGEILNDRTLQQFRYDIINDIISSTVGEVSQNADPGITARQPTF